LRLGSHHFSPAVLGQIVRAAGRSRSFQEAADSLADLAEVAISGRQTGRIAHEVGAELQQARDQQVEAFQADQLRPEVTVAPKLAVVEIDGGRVQVRAEDQGRGVHDPAWREDKIAQLVTMTTPSHDHDPHPELPRCFTAKKSVVELVQGLTSQGTLADVVDATAVEPPPLAVFEPTEEGSEPPRWQPEPVVRTCVASTEDSETFGPMAAAEARRRNFFAAEKRAFLGDGGAWIWVIHRTFFPTFEPIVDFLHVSTYIYLAAKATGVVAAVIWERYLRWARACWQGRVADVLHELRPLLQGMTPPAEGEEPKPTDPYAVVSRVIGYLENNQSRMDYARYRQQGLPITSSLVESLVKQFNHRVKGTEKFWNESQAETILQLRAAQLSEDDRLTKHLKTRLVSPFRRYESGKRRKAG
jgi:hypothetical protein